MRVCTVCGTRYEDDPPRCPADGAKTLPEVPGQAADPLVGRTVGSYRIERLLGRGGMSVVYQAVQPAIGSRVAVKFLRTEYAADRTIVTRFFNEAKAVNLIDHDNIVRILDFNLLDGEKPYFVMELLGTGEELSRLARRPVGLDVAGPIVLQVCAALQAAHAQGVVHRDLKPDNIFLAERSGRRHVVKLMDFGIAKMLADDQRHTSAGMVMGTPHYMSPEQASGKTRTVDGRSDLYSLGVVMFQLATGVLPFDGESYAETLVKHLTVLPANPRDLNPNVEPAYEGIILRCLAKDPAERFQSARELAQELAGLMTSLGLSLDPPRTDELSALSRAATPRMLPPKAPVAQGIVAKEHTPAVGVVSPAMEREAIRRPMAESIATPAATPRVRSEVANAPSPSSERRSPPMLKRPSISNEPAWSKPSAPAKPVALSFEDETTDAREIDEETVTLPKRSGWPYVLLVFLLGGGAAFGWYWFKLRPAIDPAAVKAFEDGRKLYFADVRARFDEAKADFDRAQQLAGGHSAPADAALAELQAAWAEHLREEADALEAAHSPNADATKLAAMRTEATTHAAEACRLAKMTTAAAPNEELPLRSLLACARVTRDEAGGEQTAAALTPFAQNPETEAGLAAWSFEKSSPDLGGAETHLTDASAALPAFVRAKVWLARVHEAEGHRDAAKVQLQSIVAASPGDESASALLDALAPTTTVAKNDPPPPTPAAPKTEPATAPKSEPKSDPKTEPKHADASKPEHASNGGKVDVDKLIREAHRLEGRSKTKALDLYEQVLDVEPKNVEALYGKGVAMFDLGQVDKAIDALEAALKVSPKFADAMIVLGDAYKMQGDKPNAIRCYRKYLDTMPDGQDAPVATRSLKELQ